MSQFSKNEMFEVFQQNPLKRKTQQTSTDETVHKKNKHDNNNVQNLVNPMKKLEETLELPLEKHGNSDIEEDKEIDSKEITEKEKKIQKKYMLEKFDIDITTEDFGCVHEIISPKGYQRKGINYIMSYF